MVAVAPVAVPTSIHTEAMAAPLPMSALVIAVAPVVMAPFIHTAATAALLPVSALVVVRTVSGGNAAAVALVWDSGWVLATAVGAVLGRTAHGAPGITAVINVLTEAIVSLSAPLRSHGAGAVVAPAAPVKLRLLSTTIKLRLRLRHAHRYQQGQRNQA